MNPAEALALQRRCLRGVAHWMAGATADARLWEADGVTAAIVPATAQRSVVNSVVYDDAEALAARHAELARVYERAGVSAWTVWVPEWDTRAIELLTARGHAFDGSPAAMSLELEGFEGPDAGELDWDDAASFAEFGAVNDDAYGFAPGTGLAAAFGGVPAGLPLRLYRARVGGETAAVLATLDHDDDVGIHFVATAERHRGRGLATRLLAAALRAARQRGMRTSSLQASSLGETVYVRLGYRTDFRLHLYELRS